jgi:serine/threonine-protein kinase
VATDQDRAQLPTASPPSAIVRAGLEHLIELNERDALTDAGGDAPLLGSTSSIDSARSLRASDVVPGCRLGAWIIEGELGRGGFGTVWSARHALLAEQRAAVKILHISQAASESVRARFRQEAVASIRIKSDHVVHVYDYGVLVDDTPYIVMELLEGESLAVRLARGPLAPGEVARIADEMCLGLAAVHRAGIVHRDLNPGNIFVCSGSSGRVKILDFGISKTSVELTQSRMLIGMLPYIPPEVFEGGGSDVDPRADLHALAVVLYESITGHRAFRADSAQGYAAVITTRMPAPIHRHRPDVPTAVNDVLFKAMAKRTDRRYRDVEQFRAAFAGAVAPWLLGRVRTRSTRGIPLVAIGLVAAGVVALATVRTDQPQPRIPAPVTPSTETTPPVEAAATVVPPPREPVVAAPVPVPAAEPPAASPVQRAPQVTSTQRRPAPKTYASIVRALTKRARASCTTGRVGKTVEVSFHVKPTGVPTLLRATGMNSDTPAGECVLALVRATTFSPSDVGGHDLVVSF